MSQSEPQEPPPSTDPFDSLLTLEDTLYTTAYTLGARDGAQAGRIEGRIFGLEKGFEKFAALGNLHGRAVVWAAQLQTQPETKTPISVQPGPASQVSKTDGEGKCTSEKEHGVDAREKDIKDFPRLNPTARLQSHISTLHGLTDPHTFSTLNTEDAVADYDDRFKRAGAKAKIVERMVNTNSSSATGSGAQKKVATKGDDNMEDFTGSRFLR